MNAVEEQPLVAPWLRALNQHFAVVRPDHYVFATAKTAAETIALVNQLTRELHHPQNSKEISL